MPMDSKIPDLSGMANIGTCTWCGEYVIEPHRCTSGAGLLRDKLIAFAKELDQMSPPSSEREEIGRALLKVLEAE